MANRLDPKFPTIEETLNHPAYPSTIWLLEPHRQGTLPVAKDRGGPVNIAWEIHGSGPTKICFIMGLAGVTASWQRQTKYFGHERGDTYSVLIIDNRGMGASDKPVARYSTSEMALDLIEVLDHVGWTSSRGVNVVGISLGGMIAQEVACAIPERLASLSLVSTSAEVQNTQGYLDWAKERLGFVVPKSQEQAIVDTARKIFVDEWLEAPDVEEPPSPESTPRCKTPPGGKYLMFDNNFQRFQAQEVNKRRHPHYWSTPGFLCQLIAAGWHRKSDAQLKEMADKVGRERIMVMHGNSDKMIIVANGQRLIDIIQPDTGLIVDGMGHAPVMERQKYFNELLEERLKHWGQV